MRLSYLNRLRRSKAWSALANYLKARRENLDEAKAAQSPQPTAVLEDYVKSAASLLRASIVAWPQPDELPRAGWEVANFEVRTIQLPNAQEYTDLWSVPVSGDAGLTVGHLIASIARERTNSVTRLLAYSPKVPHFRSLYPAMSLDTAQSQTAATIDGYTEKLQGATDPAVRAFFSTKGQWGSSLNYALELWDQVYQEPLARTVLATEWAMTHRESYWTQGSCSTPSARVEDHAAASRDAMTSNLTVLLASVVALFVHDYRKA